MSNIFLLPFSEDTVEESIDIKNEPLEEDIYIKNYGYIKSKLDEIFDCPHCGEVFSNFAEVEGHIITEHKGQLISEWLFDVLNFPKKQCKNLNDFCPRI